MRANFYYIDDIGRATFGYIDFGFSRHLADIISPIIHMSKNPIVDIAPLTQYFAVFICCIAISILVYIFNNKINILLLLAGIPLCFSPYFLENLSYRYDSINMSLSVLYCIIPFLFIQSLKVYLLTSFLSLIAVCTSYQASTGIFIILTCMISYKNWIYKEKSARKIFIFIISSALIFLISLLFFKLLITNPIDANYVSNKIFSLPNICDGLVKNTKNIFMFLYHDLSTTQKILICILFILFLINSIQISKQNKFLTSVIGFLMLLLLIPLSFGAYIVLEKPLWAPRAFIGIGVLFSVIQIFLLKNAELVHVPARILSKTIIFLFSYSLITFTFAYGNALAEQKRWNEFRAEQFLSDLSKLELQYPVKLQIKNNIGNPKTTSLMSSKYPIIKRLVNPPFGNWWGERILSFYNLNYNYISDDDENFEALNLPLLVDTSYHTIKGTADRILLVLK
ncbi:MAG: glucosyltransferase domain-containing protein [Treponemataceae bacterium]